MEPCQLRLVVVREERPGVLRQAIRGLLGHEPVVIPCVLEPSHQHRVEGQLLEHPRRHFGPPRDSVRHPRLVEPIVIRQPVGVRQVHLIRVLRVLLQERERVVPLVLLHVQRHQTGVVAELVVRLLGVRGVAPPCKVTRTLLNHLGVILDVEQPHDLHQLIPPVVLAHQRHGLLELLRLDVHVHRGFVIARLLRPLSLAVNKIFEGDVSAAVRLGVLLGPYLRFVEHSHFREHLHRLVRAATLGVLLGRLVKLALIREAQSSEHKRRLTLLEPLLSVGHEVDVLHVAAPDEALTRHLQVHPPVSRESEVHEVLIRHAKARNRIRAVKVPFLDVILHAPRVRHDDGLHADVVQAVYLRCVETHGKTVEVLRVNGEVRRLDGQDSIARVAEHVLVDGVERHRVGTLALEQDSFCLDVVHDDRRVLIHHSQLLSERRHVEAPNGRAVVDELHRKVVVDENFQAHAILETHQHALSLLWAAVHFDVPNHGVHRPRSLLFAFHRVQQQLLLHAQDDVVRGDDEQVTLEVVLNRGHHPVLHVVRIVALDLLINHQLIRQLHRQLILVHRDLLHVVLAPDAHLLIRLQLLHDDVRHEVPVRVELLVHAVHRGEGERVRADGPVLGPDRDGVVPGPRPRAPHPRTALAQRREHRTLLRAQPRRFVRPTHHHVVAAAKVRHRTRIKAQARVVAHLHAVELVERERAVPAPDRHHVVGLPLVGVPRQRPDGRAPLDLNLLATRPVPHRHAPVVLPEREVLAVLGPPHAENLAAHLVFLHGLLLRSPEPKVAGGGGRELHRAGVEREALHRLVVVVLEDALSLRRPDDDGLVRAAGREPRPFEAPRYRVHRILVSLERVEQGAVLAPVNQNPIAHPSHQLGPIGFVGDVVADAAQAVPVGRGILPAHRGSHFAPLDDRALAPAPSKCEIGGARRSPPSENARFFTC